MLKPVHIDISHLTVIKLVHALINCVSVYNVWFVFTSSCLYEDSRFIYVFCVYLCIMVSNTYCVVFLFCLSSSCVPYIASFSGLSILIASSVFSNIYYGKRCVCYTQSFTVDVETHPYKSRRKVNIYRKSKFWAWVCTHTPNKKRKEKYNQNTIK